jgi:hypothetical protein
MATMQHRIFCFSEFIRSESATAVQRAFRLHFNIEPPTRKSICRWNRQFQQTGKPPTTGTCSSRKRQMKACRILWSYAPKHGTFINYIMSIIKDRLCGLVVRVSGYRYRGPGFASRPYQIFWEVGGLERGPLSLVRTIEEYLNEKVAAPV